MSETNGHPSYLCPPCVEHEVNGKVLRFYPVGVELLSQLKTLAKPVSQAMFVLMTQADLDERRGDSAVRTKSWKDGPSEDGAGTEASETDISAVPAETIRLRVEQGQAAVEKLVDALTDRTNAQVLARLVMDSLHEEHPRPVKEDDVKKYATQLDVVSAGQLIMGVLKANAGAFGPFRPAFEARLRKFQEAPSLSKTS